MFTIFVIVLTVIFGFIGAWLGIFIRELMYSKKIKRLSQQLCELPIEELLQICQEHDIDLNEFIK